MAADRRRLCAAAALEALDMESAYEPESGPQRRRSDLAGVAGIPATSPTHELFTWRVPVAQPHDWHDHPDPRSLRVSQLEQFPESEYRTIALYRLGGLADAGALRPIVPRPKSTGNLVADAAAYAAWRSRLPIHDDHLDDVRPPLCVRALPPDIAEQLFEGLVSWASAEAAARGESFPESGLSASTERLGLLQRRAPAVGSEQVEGAADAPTEKVTTAKGARDNFGIVGAGADWEIIQARLLAKRDRREPYTSCRALSKELKCSDATIRKAIGQSETLKGWKARSRGPKAAPKATDLSAAVRDNTRQTTEPAPDDVLPDDDVDAVMARLINHASPEDRAKLNALDDASRRELVATYHSHNLDNEPSPLEPDKPGERPRKVKQHKRA